MSQLRAQFVLYAGDGAPPPLAQADETGILWNDSTNSPAGYLSLQREMNARLVEIRAEHARWAYETGFLDIGGANLAALLECGATPSMWWTSTIYERHPKVCPGLFDIYKLRCLEMLLLERQCAALRLVGGDETLAAALRELCAAHGIQFSVCGKENKKKDARGPLARIYAATPAPLRALARFAHWWWTIRRPLGAHKKDSLKTPASGAPAATIAAYFPNIDLRAAGENRFRSRYWESLHDALDREANAEKGNFVRWLFIRFSSPNLTFRQCLKLRGAFTKSGEDGLDFNFLEEFLTFTDLCAAIARWFKLCVKSLAIQARVGKHFHFQNSRLNFWPYLKPAWKESFRGWRCLERCLQNLAFRRYCRLAGQPRWVLFPLENCPWERMLTEASRAAAPRTPVFGAQHSIIRPADFRYFDDPRTFTNPATAMFQPDVLGGNGDSAKTQLLANGLPPDRFRELEALRYLYITAMKNAVRPSAWQNELPPQPGEPLEPYSAKRLLVLTSFFADETKAHLELLGQAFAAGILEGWEVVIKPHPCQAVDWWLQTQPAPVARNIWLATGPIELELKPGVTVWASNSTTAALEAALLGLPVMVMRPLDDFDLCPIQNVPGLARTGCLADIPASLETLAPLNMPDNYLDLDSALPAWRRLLGLC